MSRQWTETWDVSKMHHIVYWIRHPCSSTDLGRDTLGQILHPFAFPLVRLPRPICMRAGVPRRRDWTSTGIRGACGCHGHHIDIPSDSQVLHRTTPVQITRRGHDEKPVAAIGVRGVRMVIVRFQQCCENDDRFPWSRDSDYGTDPRGMIRDPPTS